MLDKAAVSYQIILTKSDKIKKSALDALEEETLKRLAKFPAAFPHIVTTSSEKGLGIGELRAIIATLL